MSPRTIPSWVLYWNLLKRSSLVNSFKSYEGYQNISFRNILSLPSNILSRKLSTWRPLNFAVLSWICYPKSFARKAKNLLKYVLERNASEGGEIALKIASSNAQAKCWIFEAAIELTNEGPFKGLHRLGMQLYYLEDSFKKTHEIFFEQFSPICGYCSEQIKNGLIICPNWHIFHESCIVQWANEKTNLYQLPRLNCTYTPRVSFTYKDVADNAIWS